MLTQCAAMDSGLGRGRTLNLQAIRLPLAGIHEPAAVLAFALFAAVFYAWAGPDQKNTDGWFPLAQSMLQGHLWIDGSRPWIEMAQAGGHWYLPFPPIPAVVLMPVVAVAGIDGIDTSGATAAVGGLNVCLMWALLRSLELDRRAAAWLLVSFAFGSEALYVAATGGVHLWAETLGLCFALLSLLLSVRCRFPLVAGAAVVLAAGCRLPYLIAAAPVLAGYVLPLRSPARDWPKPTLLFCAGAIPFGLLILAYNLARFGDPLEFGYSRIISAYDGSSVLSEPWYASGIISPTYLARGLYSMLARGFGFSESPPWLIPSRAGASVLMTMPVLVFLTRSIRRQVPLAVAWVGFAGPLFIDLIHGNPGYAQFGYRFFLDGLPFAWLLLAIVIRRDGLTHGMKVAIVVGVLVNLYGMWCISNGFVGG
jgi:hypothetical protein